MFYPGSGSEAEEDLWNGGETCEKPCSGESCMEMAALMENLIDLTIDPCDAGRPQPQRHGQPTGSASDRQPGFFRPHRD